MKHRAGPGGRLFMEIIKNASTSQITPATESEPAPAAEVEVEPIAAAAEQLPEQLPEPGPEPLPPLPPDGGDGGPGMVPVPVPVPVGDEAYAADQEVVTSSIEEEVQAISMLLDQAVARLADLQEQLPFDAQPIVVYMSDIIEGVGDTIEFMFDSLIDEVGGDTDAEMQEAVEVIGDEAAARPEDLRDLAMTLQHVPGVEDHHLVRLARLADVLGEALSRTRGVRDTVNANPAAYAQAFGQGQ